MSLPAEEREPTQKLAEERERQQKLAEERERLHKLGEETRVLRDDVSLNDFDGNPDAFLLSVMPVWITKGLLMHHKGRWAQGAAEESPFAGQAPTADMRCVQLTVELEDSSCFADLPDFQCGLALLHALEDAKEQLLQPSDAQFWVGAVPPQEQEKKQEERPLAAAKGMQQTIYVYVRER